MTPSGKAIASFVLIMMACVGLLSFWSEVRSEEDRSWVRHTYLVVEKLQAVRIDITQAETGQRAFLLTGRDRHLELFNAGVLQLRQDLNELSSLTADNPRETEAIVELDPLIAARLEELGDGIDARRRSGLLAGVEHFARVNEGERSMERIAAQIGGMRQMEEQLLDKRLHAAEASTRKIKIVIVCGNALAILVLLGKLLVIHWETGKRNLAEQNLKMVNERLERRTAELSETNIELESFAYSVAHDLRAPLRHIAGYANLLVQDFAPRLDVEGLRCLGKIEESAHKMGTLVDDLLNLSKIGRQKLSIRDTPLDALVAQVVKDFATECQGRDIDWRIGNLFSVECDRGLIEQVFVNLISNAVKYTGKRERAVIEVGQTVVNGEAVIFVRDNGAGFEMQYAEKLFGVFQRLHKASDFEGTGVGLAIVQRIIRKHSGRIWAEAEVDRGATFFFTIGSRENAASEELERPTTEEEIYVARS
jgi:signal transduction histidine kinase